ncbi:MAG: tRNA lysidine(34) synthetase TilS [Actinomycetota bacterium]|nr:tRNA lysidine(34) synthetase TilS [Actinomycetota bacterium]
MSAPHPAVAQVRAAVHRFLAAHPPASEVAVACSGGADSLALAAATVSCGVRVHGLVVDHGLQPDSAEVAAGTAAVLRSLGCAMVTVLPITVDGPGGPEAAARRARYAALRSAAPTGALVLLGHTRDDQAETVLLGLGRGSGPRSIAGMRAHDPPWGRPLLDLPRSATVAACAAQGLRPWCDPHNADPRFRRVRLRTEVLPLLEKVLGDGVAGALARTAAQLREDLDVLDALAVALLASAYRDGALDVPTLTGHPAAVRRRVLREWLLPAGVRELTDAHLRAVDDLVGRWRGQGEVALPGGFVVARAHGRLHLDRAPAAGGDSSRSRTH